MVRLRDLGGGEPNDDLTWALFDKDDDTRGEQSVVRAPGADPEADADDGRPTAPKRGRRRAGSGGRNS